MPTLSTKERKSVLAAFSAAVEQKDSTKPASRTTAVPATLTAPYGKGTTLNQKRGAPALPKTPMKAPPLPVIAPPKPKTLVASPTTVSKPNVVREVNLIYSDVAGNNNKVWRGVLYTNGDVHTEWGRVGKNLQSKTYRSAGAGKLADKENEKLAKGYTVAHVITGTPSTTTSQAVSNNNLRDIAIKQISQGEPVLTKLVTMLVQANIHQITSQSQITYNSTTGLFQTPLGVVSTHAINEAYYELDIIAAALNAGQLTDRTTLDHISKYLRLIPQDFGMRLDPKAMFPNPQAIQKQKDLLDALEASYNALTSSKPIPKDRDAVKNSKDDRVFEVKVKVCDPAETERIRKLYHKTRQSIHRYVSGMDVKTAYEIHIPTQHAEFEKHGRPLGNVWELWHGTKMANVLNILRVGLKVTPPRGTSIAGALYGPGLYFSDQSSKSLNYATNYWHGGGRGGDGTFFMFLANVAMGKYMVPKGGQSRRPPAGYHSYFAKAGQSGVINNEMIVPSEAQAELIRLVEFTERGK